MRKLSMMAVAVAAAQVSFGGLKEDFASPQGVARENTGPLFWLHGDETEARLREYVGRVAESGQGVLTIGGGVRVRPSAPLPLLRTLRRQVKLNVKH